VETFLFASKGEQSVGKSQSNQINMPPNSQMYAGAGVLSSCMSINPMPQMMKTSSYQQVVSFFQDVSDMRFEISCKKTMGAYQHTSPIRKELSLLLMHIVLLCRSRFSISQST